MPALAAGNQAQLLSQIYQERRVELCFEGHRFFDLRRWGMGQLGSAPALGIVITPKNAGDTTFTYQVDTVQLRVWPAGNAFIYYPIPRTETQINPNITQNPGYN
jgi:hypothetical protein